jgi:heat shock protein HtpX
LTESRDERSGSRSPLLEQLLAQARQAATEQLSSLEGRLREAESMGVPIDAPAQFREAQAALANLGALINSATYEQLSNVDPVVREAEDKVDQALRKGREIAAAKRVQEVQDRTARQRLFLAVAAVTVFYGLWVFLVASIASAIWPYAFIFVLLLVAGYFGLVYWQAPLITKLQMPIRSLRADEAQRLMPIVSELAPRAGLVSPELGAIVTDEINAFAVGRRSKSAVFVTQPALEQWNDTELRGVLAHELGHVHNNDSLALAFFISLGSLAGWVARIADWFLRLLDQVVRRTADELQASHQGQSAAQLAQIFGFLFRMFIWIFVLVLRAYFWVCDKVAQLAVQAQSREVEFAADAFAARMGHAGELSQALAKIEGLHAPPPETDPLARLMSNLFATHPPTAERLARLRAITEAGEERL